MGGKRFRIPDEDVRLTSAEVRVTQTRQFQRLNFVKQLGLAYQVYTGAAHTRGAHGVQCVAEAAKILAALEANAESDAEREVIATAGPAIRMAALLHDIGHIPYSHTLENEHPILSGHDGPARLGNALAILKSELKGEAQVHDLIDAARPILEAVAASKSEARDWRSDLVGNTVCADLLANIKADPAWSGIEKRPGHYRIYEYFAIKDERLCIKLTKGGLRNDIVSAILDILDMRYALTERVLFHHAKCVSSAMLARAARLVDLQENERLLRMGDEAFLDYLEGLAQTENVEGALHLIDGIRSRRLYQRIFKVGTLTRDAWESGRSPESFCSEWRDRERVEALLVSVEDTHGLPRGSLVLWCPEWKSGMKLAQTQVIWEGTDGSVEGPVELRSKEVERHFPGVHKRVTSIEDQYLDLWTFWIALDREHVDKAARVMCTLEDEMQIPCDRVFVETYLYKSIPGFQTSEAQTRAVSRVMRRRLEPRVSEQLAQQASYDGQEHTDEASILGAAATIAKDQLTEQQTLPVDGD